MPAIIWLAIAAVVAVPLLVAAGRVAFIAVCIGTENDIEEI
jgi:hypothetical protein